MSQKGDIISTIVGTTMAAGPSLVVEHTPFYETTIWLTIVAILGMLVLVVTLINGVYKWYRNATKKLQKEIANDSCDVYWADDNYRE